MAKIDKNTVVDASQDDSLTWMKSGNNITLGPYPDKTYVDKNVEIVNEPGGNTNDVQINASGKFVGDNGLTFNRTTDQLNVRGNVTVGGYIKGKIVTNRFNFFLAGGNSGQVLSTDGTGNLNWVDQTGSSGNSTITVSEISGSTISNQVSSVSSIRFDKDTGFSVDDLGNGSVKVSLGSSWKTWEVAGQSSLVAQGEDTVQFVAGTNTTITTNVSAKSITFNSTYGNSSVANYLPTFTGNVAAGNLKTDNLLYSNGVAWSFGSTYSNANVASYLPTFTGNVAAGNVKTDNLLYSNGVAWNLNGTYSNANVANYLPTHTGNLNGGNLVITNGIYAYNFSSTGTSFLTTLQVNAQSQLGSVSNVKITGGSANYVLTTDGAGNLSWQDPSDATVIIGNVAPNTTVAGTVWWNSEAGRSYIKYNDQWVDMSPAIMPDIQEFDQSLNTTDDVEFNNLTVIGEISARMFVGDGSRLGNLPIPNNTILINDIAPSSAIEGTVWFNSQAGRSFVKYDEQWVDMSPMVLQPLDSSIENNGFELSISNTGKVEFPGSLNVSESEWTFGTDGTLTVPGLVTRPVDETLILVTTGSNGNSASISIDGEFGRTLLRTYDGETLNTWSFGNTGDLTVPGNILSTQSSNLIIGSSYSVKIVGDNGDNNLTWTFDGSSGEIQLPFGAIIDPSDDNFEVRGVENVNFEANAVVNIYTDTSNNGFNWQFGDDGNLTLPGNTFAVNYANGQQVSIGGGSANTGNVTFNDVTVQGNNTSLNLSAGADFTANLAYLQVRAGDVSTHIHLDTGNNEAYDQYFGNDNKFVKLGLGTAGNVSIGTYQDGGIGQLEWTFDSNGNLVLPKGGVVYETNIPFGGLDGNTIALKPSGGTNDDQQLLVYPTAGQDFNHLHLTSGNLYNTELFLGNDDLYVKIANTGNIVINSNDGGGNTAQWTFDTTGTIATSGNLKLQTPSGGTPNSLSDWNGGGGWNQSSYINLTTTGGTGTGLTVDVAAGGSGYISIEQITINTPGGGYTDGDVITIENENNLSGTFIIGVVSNTWNFDTDGNLKFPDNTIQTTAWTGILPNPTFVGSDEIGFAPPAPLNLNNSAEATLLTQLNLINTGGAAGAGSAIDFWTYTTINDVPQVRLQAVDDGDYSADFAIRLKAPGGSGFGSLTTSWTYGADGILTLPHNSYIETEDANLSLGSQSNVTIRSNAASSESTNSWVFSNSGNLILPGGYTVGETGDTLLLSAPGTSSGIYMDWNSEISFFAGNAGAQNIAQIGTLGGVWIFDNDGALTAPGNISTTGNITANYILGNGSQLTGISAASISNGTSNVRIATSNANVQIFSNGNSVANITGTGANITGTLSVSGTLTSNSFNSIGSSLNIGTSTTTSMAIGGSGTTSITIAGGTASNGVSYTMNLFPFGGVYDASSNRTLNFGTDGGYNTGQVKLNVGGQYSNTYSNIYGIVNVYSTSSLSGTINVVGAVTTGANAILAGPAFTPLPNTMAGFNSNVNSYTQLTIQNKSTGSDATTEFVATADNGSDTVNFLDMGIINSGYDNNTPTNSLGNIVYAADSYIYAQGNASATSQSGGNLAIGTTVAGKTIKFFAGGNTSSSLIASFANTGANITGNLSVSGNFSLTGNLTGSSPNVTLVAGNYSTTFDNTGTATFPGPITVPTLPAFRVYGTLNTNIIGANTITTTNGATVDYNQGSYYNNTTGLFTAPIAGLYHCYGTVRVGNNNGLNQVGILKNNSTGGANVIGFWETDTNTGTAVHFNLSGYAKCVVGDTISLKVITGNVLFDSNDSWGVTFIG